MKMIFRLRQGSVQSKVISLLVAAPIILSLSVPISAYATDYPPSVPNANVFGGNTEAPKVDEPTGAFTQRIPLDIPPGRNGLQPELSLQYNSQNTTDGIVGYGWSLSIPYIERLNKTGSQDLYGNTPYFASSIEGELASEATTTPLNSVPTILDTIPSSGLMHNTEGGTSLSFSYTVPSGGQNKMLIVLWTQNSATDPTALSLNGVSATSTITRHTQSCSPGMANHYFAYLPAPTSGTFSMTWSGSTYSNVAVFTVQDALQVSPIDDENLSCGTASSKTTVATTTVGNDLLLSFTTYQSAGALTSFGTGEAQVTNGSSAGFGSEDYVAWKAAASSSALESMTSNLDSSSRNIDLSVIAIKPIPPVATATSTTYRAKVDEGSFNAYSFSDNTWTMYDKKGVRYTYGSSDSGRMYDTGTGTSTKTFRWMLQEIRDTNGNYLTYTYNRDNNVLYPDQISYTGRDSTDGIFAVEFTTEDRPDIRQSYASGFLASTTKRVSEIDASVNGSIVHKYLLNYGVGHNGYRSLLTSIYEQGYDESGTLTTLPGTAFTYSTSSTQFYAPASQRLWNSSYVVSNVNGNGTNDTTILRYHSVNGDKKWIVYPDNSLNSSDGEMFDTWSSTYGGPGTYNPHEHGVRLVDVNGDGKADIVVGTSTSQALYVNTFSTTTGAYSWTASTTYAGGIPVFATSAGIVTGLFGNLNGDALPDFTQNIPGYVSSHLGIGSTWNSTSTFAAPKQFPTLSSGPTETASQLVDINGDGLDDWVYSESGKMYALLNNGTGWNSSASPQWTIATSTLYEFDGSYYDRGIRFMDLNGDGLPDFVRAYQVGSGSSCTGAEVADVKVVYLNTGNGWATSTAYTLPEYITTCDSSYLANNEYANFNGNGQMEQDVLKLIVYPKGSTATVDYSLPLSTNPELPFPLLTVNTLATGDGLGNFATTTYEYAGGRMYLTEGPRERKFGGFAVATTTAPDSITATYYNQGYDVNTARGEQSDGFGQINHPFRKDVLDLSGNIKQRSYYRWDTVEHGASTFVGLGREMTWDYASDGSHRDRATEYQYSSSTNDLIKKIEYGEVTGSSDGTFTETGSDKRTTNFSYAASSSVNMSVPIQKTLLDYNSATTSDQKLYYDSLAFGSVTVGNNTEQEDWISGTTYASTTKTYNSYGLVATSMDRNGNATSYLYDQHNLFLATSTNALLQQTQFLYNYSNGKAKWKSDPNSSLTQNTFDGLGRLTEVEVSATSSPSTYATLATYTYTESTSTPSSILRSDSLFDANTVDTYQYFDGFNRLIQERRESPTAGTYFVSDRVYNKAGLLASTSLPYASSGSSRTSLTGTTALYTNYSYDALQRVTNTSNAVGDTTNAYYQWKKTTTDPNGNVKEYWSDAFGNLVNVVEHISATLATTTYAYGTLNNLATTTDASGNIRRFTYDGLSRRLTAEDLHASGDSTFGTWTYTYDHQGNMTSQTDPKSQVVNRTYDALNRMLTEDYTGDAGTEVTLVYDSCTNGVGYLCSASSTSATTTNAYDIRGRITSATTTVLGASAYNMQYSYDRQGNMTSATYPSGGQVMYTYNAAGFPSRIERKPSGGSFSDIVTNYDYAPHGQVLNILFGNSASTTHFYDADALYRLSNLQTKDGAGGTYIQKFAYTYDDVGNITQIANAATSSVAATSTYSYDTLNRLLSASAPGATSSPYTQSFTYDALGNMLTNTIATGTASTATTSPTIMDTIPSGGLFHNMEAGTSLSFSYTVPSGGSNKLLVVMFGDNSGGTGPTTLSQNGVSFTDNVTHQTQSCSPGMQSHYFAYLPAPTSGTFSMTYGATTYVEAAVFTVQDAAQSNPIDVDNLTCGTASSKSTSVSTNVGNDLLLSYTSYQSQGALTSFGTGEAQVTNGSSAGFNSEDYVAWKAASSSPATETMTSNLDSARNIDLAVIAIKQASAGLGSDLTSTYTYAGTDYANPHAPTQIGNGLSTTSFAYDNNGNVTQKTTDGITTTYEWDYANRLIALGSGGATTTYGYDAFGQRVLQTGTSTTTIYPFKWYSVASSTESDAQFATTTEYIFNGEALISTVDQQFASGVATGSPQTRYIHPDHLGSTNVVTDEDGEVVQTLDFYPYGSTRVSEGVDASVRKYIGQFTDDSSLSYLQQRYYDPSRGQFLTQDPTFWSARQNLANPQSLNSYSYAEGNPITKKDPNGLSAKTALSGLLDQLASTLSSLLYQISQPQFVQQYQAAKSAVSFAQNPGAAMSSTWNSGRTYISDTARAFKTIGRSEEGDYLLGERAADLLPLLFIKRPLGAAAIPDEALVVRGGRATAASIDANIAKSKALGVEGFSVQCTSACTDISQIGMLGQFVKNDQLSVTTAGAIRAAGGNVISTPGKGFHATVPNLSGQAASQLPWWVVTNPNPLR